MVHLIRLRGDIMGNKIGTSDDITITIKDGGNIVLAGVQSYSVKCDLDYTKISAVGEVQPTDYYVNGRTYTITLNRVHLLNSTLSDGLSFYNKNKFKDFELIIKKKKTSNSAKDRISVFRNCYSIESGEDGDIGSYVSDKIVILSHNLGYESDDTKYKRLKHMIYKGFTFPYNPSTTEFSSNKKYVEHKFPGLKNNDIEDFGSNCATLKCEGYFYGDGAWDTWNKLLSEYNKKGAGKVYHPLFGSIDKGLMINLSSNIDSHSSLIHYSFEILEYDPSSVKKSNKKKSTKKSTKKSAKKSGKVKSKNELKIGSSVYVTGYIYKTSTGTGKGKKYSHKKMTVTKINSSGSHPVHVGSVGWVDISELSWS